MQKSVDKVFILAIMDTSKANKVIKYNQLNLNRSFTNDY